MKLPSSLFDLDERDVFVGIMLIVVSRMSEYVPEAYVDDLTLVVGGIFYIAHELWKKYTCDHEHDEEPPPDGGTAEETFEDWLDEARA